MKHGIKKYIIFICLFAFGFFTLVSCTLGGGTTQPHEHTECPICGLCDGAKCDGAEEEKCTCADIEVTQEMLNALKYENTTVKYDGKAHGIYVDNIYEKAGVTVTYSNNENYAPGKYVCYANISYPGLRTLSKRATLTIEKGDSELTIESNQVINVLDDTKVLEYTASTGDQQQLVVVMNGKSISLDELIIPGEYTLEVYLGDNGNYADSNHEFITVIVENSNLGIKFASKEFVADGEVHTLEIEGALPTGYSVNYKNNEASEDGTYYAVAEIVDAAGKIVETHRAILTIENPENAEFAKYLDDFFVTYLEDDQLSVNIFCENPANFGLEHYEASWYEFTPFEDEELEQDLEMFRELLAELQSFEDAPLDDLQESAYETVEKFLKYYIDFYSVKDAIFMNITYVDQFGGYIADFGTYMEAYSLRSELEVQDIVDYFESTKTAFPSYLLFLEEKVERGYALSDYTIGEMKTYLEDVISQGENYYLKDIIFERVDACEFLTDEAKESYKEQIASAIKECFVPGVEELYAGLDNYLGKLSSEDEGYLSKYENGQSLYLLDLMNKMGVDSLDTKAYIEEVEKELKAAVDEVIDTQDAIVKAYNITTYAELEKILASAVIIEGTPEEMLEYLKEFAKTIVPELTSNPEINVKQMDPAAAKASNAVAYYMKSALDSTSPENITLNPAKLASASSNDVLSTLAHEGYPGHLYAYVHSKEIGLSNLATVMTSVGHAEGWATYVTIKLFEYAKASSNNAKFNMAMDYLIANEKASFLLETRLDAGVHLEGWGPKEIAKCMSGLGYSADSAESIYNLLIEIPTQYVSYGYGKMVMFGIHEEAEEILGAYYNEVEFNEMVHSKGWTDLAQLEATYHDYMAEKCHLLGIDFE